MLHCEVYNLFKTMLVNTLRTKVCSSLPPQDPIPFSYLSTSEPRVSICLSQPPVPASPLASGAHWAGQLLAPTFHLGMGMRMIAVTPYHSSWLWWSHMGFVHDQNGSAPRWSPMTVQARGSSQAEGIGRVGGPQEPEQTLPAEAALLPIHHMGTQRP